MLAGALQQAAAAQAQDRPLQAEQFCLAALKADRDNFDALQLLGVVLAQQGRHEEALKPLARAVKARPDGAQSHRRLADALCALGRCDDAIASYRRAVAIDPDCADAYYGMALALERTHRRSEAWQACLQGIAGRRRALAREPGNFLDRYRLSREYATLDCMEEARACCKEALDINPDCTAARGAYPMYQLPAIFEDEREVAPAREAFARELAAFDAWLEARRPADGYAAFDDLRTFYLAYQELDNRELLSRFGDVCARTLARWRETRAFPARNAGTGATLRIGVALAHVKSSAVWDAIVKGWIEHLDRSRFELHLFKLDATHDEQTDLAAARAPIVDLSASNLYDAVSAVLAHGIDVLIYPEIGMNPKIAVLAGLRLAPVQAASWGHPETSGLPTIDYFLSAEGFEPPQAQRQYREKLVMLPGLGCCYQPPAVDVVAPDLDRLGIAPDRPLLLCPGTPFKYAPVFDWVLVEIARRIGRCQLVFFAYVRQRDSDKLRSRLDAVFDRAGLRFGDFAVYVPWQKPAQFQGLLERADLQLDTIGFSGFNTAMQSIARGLPVVTREGRFLRGRLASGILRRIGLDELVAADEQEYVGTAVKVALDAGYRRHLRRRIESSRDALWGDVAPVRALEEFCEGAVSRSRRKDDG